MRAQFASTYRDPAASGRTVLLVGDTELRRDELIALMVAELDARLNGRVGVTVVAWPDRDNDVEQTVELIAGDSGGQVVVEHTRIESYPGQIDDHNAVYDYFERGGPDLPEAGDLGGHLMLGVPIRDFSQSLRGRRRRRSAGARIAHWARANAGRVPWPHVPGRPIGLTGSHRDIPFEWTLQQVLPPDVRLVGPLADVVRVSFAQPTGLEALRSERVELALGRKLGKLIRAAGPSRRAILVLEDRDNVMSNPIDLSIAAQRSSATHTLPDAIYVLHTRAGNPIAGVLYREGLWAHEREHFGWEQFDNTRNAQFNALPHNWR